MYRWGVADGLEKCCPPRFSVFVNLDPQCWFSLAWSGPKKNWLMHPKLMWVWFVSENWFSHLQWETQQQVAQCLCWALWGFSSHKGNQEKMRSLFMCELKLLGPGECLREMYLQTDLPRIPWFPCNVYSLRAQLTLYRFSEPSAQGLREKLITWPGYYNFYTSVIAPVPCILAALWCTCLPCCFNNWNKDSLTHFCFLNA